MWLQKEKKEEEKNLWINEETECWLNDDVVFLERINPTQIKFRWSFAYNNDDNNDTLDCITKTTNSIHYIERGSYIISYYHIGRDSKKMQ